MELSILSQNRKMRADWRDSAKLAVLLAAFFSVLEFLRPYYFLQDDNRDYFLGILAHNWRALASGSLALFNFNQFLGTPFLAAGQTGALYPPVYIAAAASKLFLGHIQGAVDFYVIFHLIAGALAMRFFLAESGVGRRGALLGALAWSLNGFAVFMSSNWATVSPVIAWLPLLLAYSARALRGDGRAVSTLTLARVLLFFSGYAQYFVCAVIFEILHSAFRALFSKEKPAAKRGLALYAASFGATFIFSLPLVLPLWHQAAISSDRAAPLSYAGFSSGANRLVLWLQGLLWPAAGAWAAKLSNRSWLDYYLPCLSHAGILAAVFAAKTLLFKKPRDYSALEKTAVCLLLVALGWSCGAFNKILYLLPVMNRFRYNFKLMLFANFWLITLGALSWNAFADGFSEAKKRMFYGCAFGLTLLNFGALYFIAPPRYIMRHNGPVPIPALAPFPLTNGRIVSIGADSQPPDGFASLAAFNYATLWNTPHLAGYQPLLPAENARAAGHLNASAVITLPPERLGDIAQYLRVWGVKYYFVDNRRLPRFDGYLSAHGIKPVFRDNSKTIFADSAARPPVYWADAPQRSGISWRAGVNSMTAQVESALPGLLVFNTLYNPFFKARVNGAAVRISRTEDGQIAVPLPSGGGTAVLYYADPHFSAGVISAAVFAAMLAGLAFIRRRNLVTLPK